MQQARALCPKASPREENLADVKHTLGKQATRSRPKSPDAAAVPADWSSDISREAQYATMWAQPAAGTFKIALTPSTVMLHLSPAASGEVLHAAVGCEAHREAGRIMHAQFAIESAQRGACVQGPVAPGRTRRAVLEEHSDDGHNRHAAVGDHRRQPLRLLTGVAGGQHLPPEVARHRRGARGLVLEHLAEGAVATIGAQPADGTLKIAPKPLGMSSNFRPADGVRYPRSMPRNSAMMKPMVASIDKRP